jgi:glyoxalase family protein
MQLKGLHHVTAVTGNAAENLAFYTKVLGLRLVKKTVNQDDVSAYHLFYADAVGTPGTDMTFFDWNMAERRRGDTDGIERTYFRIAGDALTYWQERLVAAGIDVHPGEIAGASALLFEDPEGQRLGLIDDQGAVVSAQPWDGADVPIAYALRGFAATHIVVPNILLVDTMLTTVMGCEVTGTYEHPLRSAENIIVYAMDGGGPGKEIHVSERQGQRMWALAGGVHHVAFRVGTEADLRAWLDRLQQARVGNSGFVDRYYFRSGYFRISEGILFELATDEPGFAADEPMESLGESLALPPFLESRRAEIEAGLREI